MRITIAFLCLLMFLSCVDEKHIQLKTPEKLDDGWDVALPAAVNTNVDFLILAVETIKHDNKGCDGFVVVKDGKLIVDEYYNGYHADSVHKIWSVSKLVTNTLVGMAIDDSSISSEQETIGQYLGDYSVFCKGKEGITIEHLLTMTSGIEWRELGGTGSGGYDMAYSKDWIKFVLEQPLKDEPGTVYNYSTGNTTLLAPILNNVVGKQANEYANEKLFALLGISKYDWVKMSEFWDKMENGELPSVQKPNPPIEYDSSFAAYPHMGAGLKMRPRDMAKLGQLYLNNGKWNGQQLLSKGWVTKSTQPHFQNDNYGYAWRLIEYYVGDKTVKSYFATGFGLQRVQVFPKYDLVVVFTQSNYRNMDEMYAVSEKVVRDFILKAVQ